MARVKRLATRLAHMMGETPEEQAAGLLDAFIETLPNRDILRKAAVIESADLSEPSSPMVLRFQFENVKNPQNIDLKQLSCDYRRLCRETIHPDIVVGDITNQEDEGIVSDRYLWNGTCDSSHTIHFNQETIDKLGALVEQPPAGTYTANGGNIGISISQKFYDKCQERKNFAIMRMGVRIDEFLKLVEDEQITMAQLKENLRARFGKVDAGSSNLANQELLPQAAQVFEEGCREIEMLISWKYISRIDVENRLNVRFQLRGQTLSKAGGNDARNE